MIMQPAITGTPKHLQLPLWKRLILVTALLLSGGPLAVMASTQVAYASTTSPLQYTHSKPEEQNVVNIVIICKPGNGGKGGEAGEESSGAGGGRGGDCVVTIPIKILLTVENNVLHANNVVIAGTALYK